MRSTQQHSKQSPDTGRMTVDIHGSSHSLEEAYGLAVRETNLGNFQTALDIYTLILAKIPDFADFHNAQALLLLKLKRHKEALASYDRTVTLKPDFLEAHINRGLTLQQMGQHDEALISYTKAIALNPDFASTYFNRGITFQELNRNEEALADYDKAVALKPDYVAAYNNRGIVLHEMKRYDEALASCDKALALNPEYADAYNSRGNTLASKGDMQEAENMFLKAFAIHSNHAASLFNLVSIRKYRDVNHEHIKMLQALLTNPTMTLKDKDYIYFALGKAHDDCGAYDEAFEYYRQANQIRNTAASYNPGEITSITNNIIDVFNREFLTKPFAGASDISSPVFIVGMPRSGTTLMASILSNHPSIATAGELTAIMELSELLPKTIENPIPYPQAAYYLTPAIASRLIGIYEKRLRRDVRTGVSFIVDKYPPNFRYLGFISMLFPKARIIHCMRHPLDTGLSNYCQRFSLNYDYSFDLRNIGHFYGEYAKTMDHWRSVLPLKILEVRYADMIMQTEETARMTLDFLGLEWNERCLAPHTNHCAVETASQWQVRQPIYKESVERWRHYEKHLAPLKEVLQRAGRLPA